MAGGRGGAARVESGFVARLLEDHQHLSDEQASMVRRLAGSGAGIEVVVGKAGAGKTTALAVTREAFESAGYVVSGTALSARAAEELQVAAGIPSVTLSRLLGELDDVTRVLGPSDVVVVDEAGMVGTRTIGRLVDATAASGSLLILVGDPRQLVNAGGTFVPWPTGSGRSSSTRTDASTSSGNDWPSTNSAPATWWRALGLRRP